MVFHGDIHSHLFHLGLFPPSSAAIRQSDLQGERREAQLAGAFPCSCTLVPLAHCIHGESPVDGMVFSFAANMAALARVVVGLAMLPLLYWVMISIGKNVSETYLTKETHVLVTHGPYRWVRHPLYTVATIVLVSLSVVAASWFMMAMALVAFIAIAVFVVPKEEAELIRKFGSEYREYQKRIGRFAPRLSMLG